MTKREQEVLDAIIDYITEHGYPPTIEEICDVLDIKSKSQVHLYVTRLFDKGFIESDAGYHSARAIRVKGYRFVKDD